VANLARDAIGELMAAKLIGAPTDLLAVTAAEGRLIVTNFVRDARGGLTVIELTGVATGLLAATAAAGGDLD